VKEMTELNINTLYLAEYIMSKEGKTIRKVKAPFRLTNQIAWRQIFPYFLIG